MDVKTFIKEMGVVVTEDAIPLIEKLTEKEIKKVKEKIEKEKPLFLDKNFFNDIKEIDIKIKELKEEKREISIDEFIDVLNFYFLTLSSKIERKLNPLRLTSLKNIKENENFSTIVLVRNIVRKGNEFKLEIEDKTGIKEFFIEEKYKDKVEKLKINDIIGIEGFLTKNNKIEIEKIIFPELECLNKEFDEEIKLYVRNDGNSFRISINGKIYTIISSSIIFINDFPILFVLNKEKINWKEIVLRSNLKPGLINKNQIINEKIGMIFINHSPSIREIFKNCKIFGLEEKEEVRINLRTREEIVI